MLIEATLMKMLFERQAESRGITYTDRRFRKRLELVMADNDLQQACWQSRVGRRRAGLIEAMHAAVERGELRSDLDVEAALDALLGVFYYQAVVRGTSLTDLATEQRARNAVELIWSAMEA